MANFINDFYPTPKNLIAKMVEGIKFHSVKTILEPSAGKGDILDYICNMEYKIKEYWRDNYYESTKKFDKDNFNIDAIEINPDLQKIITGKGYRLIHDDFLTFDSSKCYDLIIANFPFSDGASHLAKAIQMIERNGGMLIALVNAETIKNPYTNERKAIMSKLAAFGGDIEFLTDEFQTDETERKTSVEVALVRLTVEVAHSEFTSSIFNEMKRADEAEVSSEGFEPNKLTHSDFCADIIQRFNLETRVGIKLIDEFFAVKPYILSSLSSEYKSPLLDLKIGNDSVENRGESINSYLSKLRQKYWRIFVNNPNITRQFTSNILKEMEAKLQELRHYDFTEFNIKMILNELTQKITAGVDDAILKMFDEFSGKHSYRETPEETNIHYYNGWKTNKAWKINEKIILPINGFSAYSDKKRVDSSYIKDKLVDMLKVFKILQDRPNIDLHAWDIVCDAIYRAEQRQTFVLNLPYFDIQFYKKGTCHIKFKDKFLLDKLNIYGSQKKQWLPPNYGKVSYEDLNSEEKTIIDEFQGEKAYKEVFQNQQLYLVEPAQLMLTASIGE